MESFVMKSQVARFLGEEDGQDLVEYSVIIAMIAFAAVAGMQSLANNINQAFNNIGTKLTSYT